MPLLLACEQDEPQTEPEQTATNLATKVAGPQTSPEPTCRNASGEIVVEGSSQFRERTEDALERLPLEYATLAHCWLKTIKEGTSSGRSGVIVQTAIYYEQGDLPFAYEEQRHSIVFYAAAIVHEAVHVREFGHSRPAEGRDGEVVALTVQLAALHALEAPEFMTGCIEEIIENIDDPAYQYWEGAVPPCYSRLFPERDPG